LRRWRRELALWLAPEFRPAVEPWLYLTTTRTRLDGYHTWTTTSGPGWPD